MTDYMNEIIRDSIPIWDECLNTKFVQGFVKGTLTDDQMTKYIVEDTRYLLNYAKCFGLMVSKCNTLDEIRNYYDILSFVKEGETSVRRKFLKDHNLKDELVETTIPDPMNQLYIDALMSWCNNGSLIEGTMALLPCMLSYTYIFNKYYKEHPDMLKNNKYDYILKEYVGEMVEEATKSWIDFANKIMNTYPFSIEKCKAIFRNSSLREKDFWEMSYNNKLEFIK